MSTSRKDQAEISEVKKEKCGIIMPISGNEHYSAEHWFDVKEIIFDIINNCGLEYGLVSDSDEVNIIQKNIVTNIFENELIICDVSSKNPNVMFELGLRLAFDKPTIIIMDDKTSFIFDTQVIEHLIYPRDLRYNIIENFKLKLKDKIKATIKVSKEKGDSYSTYLQHFVKFTPKKLDSKEVDITTLITQQQVFFGNKIEQLRAEINNRQLSSFNVSNLKSSIQNITDNLKVKLSLRDIELNETFKNYLLTEGIYFESFKSPRFSTYHVKVDIKQIIMYAFSYDLKFETSDENTITLSRLN